MRITFIHLTGFIFGLVAMHAIADNTIIPMGDERIDGRQIKPYEHTWKQCAVQDGQWSSQGELTEQAVVIGDLLRLRQTTHRPDGGETVATHYLKHASLSPLRSEARHSTPDGKVAAQIAHKIGGQGYQSTIQQGGQTQNKQGKINTSMFNGIVMGLPIATLDTSLYPAEISASMLVYDAVYRVILTDAGTDTLSFNGQEVETRMIDVEWHHLGQGDIYPPGPDASGGRYWVNNNPPEGFPYVAKYKTDTYAVEFIADTCQ